MNVDLPELSTAGDVLALLALGVVNGLGWVLEQWWGPATLIITALVLVISFVADMGFSEYDDPFEEVQVNQQLPN
jgi:hypothetical protein